MVFRRRLALFAALLSPAVLLSLDRPWFILAAVLFVVAIVWSVDFLLTPNPALVDIERKLPRSVALDRFGTASWVVTNNADRAVSMTFSDEFAPSLNVTTRRVDLGVSPRGGVALLGLSKAWAWMSGRTFVTPDDVKVVAKPGLRHRLSLQPEAELEGVTADIVLDGLLESVPVPR